MAAHSESEASSAARRPSKASRQSAQVFAAAAGTVATSPEAAIDGQSWGHDGKEEPGRRSGRVVVSIGDVCGKGVVAATKTSMIRYALRGMVVAGLEPARVLAELNAMLLEAGDATSIVTLWLGYIDTARGRLLYADGGHPPALLRRSSDARIERLATTGALLGAAMLAMVFGNVVLRYAFNSGITVSEELSRWAFVWMIWTAAGLVA